MCGRYASFRDAQDLADEFAIAEIADDARILPPSWNVAPTDPVRIVVERADRSTGEIRRSLRLARWGLVPSWAKDASGGARMINARAETIGSKPAFARPFAVRRCLLPADGYFEWQRLPASPAATPGGTGSGSTGSGSTGSGSTGSTGSTGSGTRRPVKRPFYLHPRAGTAALAGLYEFWLDPTRDAEDPDRWLVSTTVVTTDAVGTLADIHDRMPLLLPPAAWDAWLDPAVDADGARPLLSAGLRELAADPISTAVNSVANNGPHLLEPAG